MEMDIEVWEGDDGGEREQKEGVGEKNKGVEKRCGGEKRKEKWMVGGL